MSAWAECAPMGQGESSKKNVIVIDPTTGLEKARGRTVLLREGSKDVLEGSNTDISKLSMVITSEDRRNLVGR